MSNVINLFTKNIITCDAELISGHIAQPWETDAEPSLPETPPKAKASRKPVNKVAGFRYAKTKGMYRASNVTFNEQTGEALSYNWWVFVSKINGQVVFNNYRYSASTSKHQSGVESLLSELGITIDLYVDAPKGLQDLNSAITHYERKISILIAEIAKPRSLARKNEFRKAQIATYKDQIKIVTRLLKKAA